MTTATLKDRLNNLWRLVRQSLKTATLKDWLNSLRRLVLGPQSLERTLALTLGGLVLAAILVLAISAVGLLRKQAEQQALARVQLAGVAAREEIRRHGEEHLTATRGLATRTPLQRLIRAGNRARLELFLRRACAAPGAHSARCWPAPPSSAALKPGIVWEDTLDASKDQGDRFLLAPAWQPDGLEGAIAPVPNLVDTNAHCAELFRREARQDTLRANGPDHPAGATVELAR